MHAHHEQQSRHLHEIAQDGRRRDNSQPHAERRFHAHLRHSQQERDARRELLEFVYGKSAAGSR